MQNVISQWSYYLCSQGSFFHTLYVSFDFSKKYPISSWLSLHNTCLSSLLIKPYQKILSQEPWLFKIH
jgi:hypothetical protein